jgi:predicted dehydrogenase
MNLAPLIARRLPVAAAEEAYRTLKEEKPRPYTVLLEYPNTPQAPVARHVVLTTPARADMGAIKLAILGAGSFARGMHIPNLKSLTDRFQIEAVVARHGPSAVATARQVGARIAATDYTEVLADPAVDAVLIATRHHLHAKMVEEALRAGKQVFVEKPLAITEEQLQNLINAVDELNASNGGCPAVFVGFNRRYSPYAVRLREAIAKRSAPINMSYRLNAGYLPADHWTHGPEGGGRALGEACHILDLFRFLTDSPAIDVCAMGVRSPRRDVGPADNFSATVRYADGSVCTLLYSAQGGKELPKEALEMHVDGQSFVMDDYKSLNSFGAKVNLKTKKQEKGHHEELIAFHKAVIGSLDRRALWQEAVEVTQTALEIDRQLRGR